MRLEQSPCSDLPPACPADIAGPDGLVNIEDLLMVLGSFGSTDPMADIDGDGDVDIEDLLQVIGSWGVCEGS